ncbi:hypothetical protein CAEBREN_22320 [Caenorhabditis brenneri]|uniref:Uncharacterized protein n=1 Tax=Caenorhabditis brenneri TaxID=135651 RepID=G0M7U8_CAEBE|nr:hypothetical protein CAEBREN_22320 [Caenorhabditis brenneri]
MPNADADQQHPETVSIPPIVKVEDEDDEVKQQLAQLGGITLANQEQQIAIVRPKPGHRFLYTLEFLGSGQVQNITSPWTWILSGNGLPRFPQLRAQHQMLNTGIPSMSEGIIQRISTTLVPARVCLEAIAQYQAYLTAEHTQQLEKLKTDLCEEHSQNLEKLKTDLCEEHSRNLEKLKTELRAEHDIILNNQSKELNDKLKILEDQSKIYENEIMLLKAEITVLKDHTRRSKKVYTEILKLMRMKDLDPTGPVTLVDDDSAVEEQPENQNFFDEEFRLKEENAKQKNEIKKLREYLLFISRYHAEQSEKAKLVAEEKYCGYLKEHREKFQATLVKYDEMYEVDRREWRSEKQTLEKKYENLRNHQSSVVNKLEELWSQINRIMRGDKEGIKKKREKRPTAIRMILDMKKHITYLKEKCQDQEKTLKNREKFIKDMRSSSVTIRNDMEAKLIEEHAKKLEEQKKEFERKIQEMKEKLSGANEEQNAEMDQSQSLSITKRKGQEAEVQDNGKRQKMDE